MEAKRPRWTFVAIGCVVGLAALLLGNLWIGRNDAPNPSPPFTEEQDAREAIDPPAASPRSVPEFNQAYATVCTETIDGMEALHTAADTGAAEFAAQVDGQRQALLQRIADIYTRRDLMDATDPLVLEYAEIIADDLAAVLDGDEIGFENLDGDVALFRSLCDDWAVPI